MWTGQERFMFQVQFIMQNYTVNSNMLWTRRWAGRQGGCQWCRWRFEKTAIIYLGTQHLVMREWRMSHRICSIRLRTMMMWKSWRWWWWKGSGWGSFQVKRRRITIKQKEVCYTTSRRKWWNTFPSFCSE